MSDLQHYIQSRKKSDTVFLRNYDEGYEEFKLSFILKKLRDESGLTQEELAKKLHTKKSAISRMENHAEDIRLSTLFKIATLLGKQIEIRFF